MLHVNLMSMLSVRWFSQVLSTITVRSTSFYRVFFWQFTNAVLPGMKERSKGIIVNLSSIAAVYPLPNYALYGATKAMVDFFSAALYRECKPYGIVVQVRHTFMLRFIIGLASSLLSLSFVMSSSNINSLKSDCFWQVVTIKSCGTKLLLRFGLHSGSNISVTFRFFLFFGNSWIATSFEWRCWNESCPLLTGRYLLWGELLEYLFRDWYCKEWSSLRLALKTTGRALETKLFFDLLSSELNY